MRSAAPSRLSTAHKIVGRPTRGLVVAPVAYMNGVRRGTERLKRPENTHGDFWVDGTCIDCDTCRWMAPDTYSRVNGLSAVTAQPTTHDGRVQAMRALLSCPTFSIHVDSRTQQELKEAQAGLPALVPGVPGVFYCGWASASSFACSAYLIVRPPEQGGNIMVDCPRFSPVLARQLEALGGARYIFLTHRDDVGDHEKWAAHFSATRILHEVEVNRGTADVEHKLRGEGPWVLPPFPGSAPQALSPSASPDEVQQHDVAMIFTPGHTRGHVCLLHRPSRALFSGDHCSAPPDVDEPQTLYVFRDFCWYDFGLLMRSMLKLLPFDWVHVLPGHGRRAHFASVAERDAAVADMYAREGMSTLLQQHLHSSSTASAAMQQATS